MKAIKGDWVRIYKVVLTPEERAGNLPEDTKKVPLELWDKGFLVDGEGAIGEEVTVETMVGREIKGELVEVRPSFDINYGNVVTETLYIGKQLRECLSEGGKA